MIQEYTLSWDYFQTKFLGKIAEVICKQINKLEVGSQFLKTAYGGVGRGTRYETIDASSSAKTSY